MHIIIFVLACIRTRTSTVLYSKSLISALISLFNKQIVQKFLLCLEIAVARRIVSNSQPFWSQISLYAVMHHIRGCKLQLYNICLKSSLFFSYISGPFFWHPLSILASTLFKCWILGERRKITESLAGMWSFWHIAIFKFVAGNA